MSLRAVWAFLTTKAGLAVLAGLLALAAAGAFLHGRSVANLIRDTKAFRDLEWHVATAEARAAQLADAERQAQEIADLNAELAAIRLAADAADTGRTRTVIKEVIRVSASAQSCSFDAVEADALNGLRLGR